MSTLYGTGEHRLVYKAEGFATGLTVTGYIWSPTLVKSDLQTFTEADEGFYYLDYTFAALGAHFGKFYEDGTVKTTGTYRVELSPADAVWDEAYAGHTDAGSYGLLVGAAFEEV